MQPRLTAVVMVFNERATIDRCLDALSFCDERIVLDDCSTDGTFEHVAQRKDVRVIQHRHVTFAAQRELGRSMARGVWLLTMDADEYVTPALARAILTELNSDNPADGYWLARRNLYPETLKGEFWTRHPRLVRTDRCRWVPTENPHSPLDTQGLDLRPLRAPGAFLDHAPLTCLATQLRKSINRSAVIAAQLRAEGKRSSPWKLLSSTIARFLKTFFWGGAWRYGLHGMIFAGAVAFEAWTKYAFLAEAPLRPGHVPTDGGPGTLSVRV